MPTWWNAYTAGLDPAACNGLGGSNPSVGTKQCVASFDGEVRDVTPEECGSSPQLHPNYCGRSIGDRRGLISHDSSDHRRGPQPHPRRWTQASLLSRPVRVRILARVPRRSPAKRTRRSGSQPEQCGFESRLLLQIMEGTARLAGDTV